MVGVECFFWVKKIHNWMICILYKLLFIELMFVRIIAFLVKWVVYRNFLDLSISGSNISVL